MLAQGYQHIASPSSIRHCEALWTVVPNNLVSSLQNDPRVEPCVRTVSIAFHVKLAPTDLLNRLPTSLCS